ncbi:hypothetical protein CAPTEDRAFT_108886, partial [Capitella teleta]
HRYGDEIMYTCDPGYKLVGPTVRTCTHYQGTHGNFSSFKPHCVETSCDSPDYPMNGEIVGTDFTLNRIIHYSCSEGYRLRGSSQSTCLSNGKWSGNTRECDPVSCGDPGPPQNGAKDGSIFYFPHSVVFSCYAGYILQGASEVQCTEGGTWSAPPPACIRKCNAYLLVTHYFCGFCITQHAQRTRTKTMEDWTPNVWHVHQIPTPSLLPAHHKPNVCVIRDTGLMKTESVEVQCNIISK